MISVAVIIPTVYRPGLRMVRKTIEAVRRSGRQQNDCSIHVVVTLNNAPADPLSPARSSLLPSSDVLANMHNRGFAQSVNDAIEYAGAKYHPDWYLVINDDAIVDNTFIARCVRDLKIKKYDAITCAIKRPDGSMESVGLRYDQTGLAFPRLTYLSTDTDMFTGAVVFLSSARVTKELQKHGFVFNPLFFAYAEDVELSQRIQRDGGYIHVIKEPLVTHLGSRTAIRGSRFQLYYGYRNLILTALLLWSIPQMIFRAPLFWSGQLYIVAMTVYKRYPFLYPRIWYGVWNLRKAILWQRRMYAA